MAAIDVNFVDNVLIVNVTGDTSSQELVAIIKEYYPRSDVSDVIWDFTNGSWHLIPQSGFREIARAAKESVESGTRQGSKTAFVGTAGLEFGLHRMYQAIAETTGVPVKYSTFKALEEARNWMKQSQ